MGYKIEIIKGHDPEGCYWFRPVLIKPRKRILYVIDIVELKDEFSIQQEVVECFLLFFLEKHFDMDLKVGNRHFGNAIGGYAGGFDPNLAHNIYPYDTMRAVARDILISADLMEKDFDDPRLDPVKKRFSVMNMCAEDDIDYLYSTTKDIPKHISVVIDFWRGFVERITEMIENNPETMFISVMGS